MIKDIHNSVYFWGAVALACFMYFSHTDYIQIYWGNDFELVSPNQEPAVDFEELDVYCWNQITQAPRKCYSDDITN